MEGLKKNTSLKRALVIGVILLLVDQIIKIVAVYTNIDKIIIENVLQLKLVLNKGIAFGIGKNNGIITFVISNVVVLGIIIRFIWLQKDRMDAPTMYALMIVLAGGISNLIDRLIKGSVIDLFIIFPKINFPVFNLADVYIVFGWLSLAFIFAKYTYEELKNRKNNPIQKFN